MRSVPLVLLNLSVSKVDQLVKMADNTYASQAMFLIFSLFQMSYLYTMLQQYVTTGKFCLMANKDEQQAPC